MFKSQQEDPVKKFSKNLFDQKIPVTYNSTLVK